MRTGTGHAATSSKIPDRGRSIHMKKNSGRLSPRPSIATTTMRAWTARRRKGGTSCHRWWDDGLRMPLRGDYTPDEFIH